MKEEIHNEDWEVATERVMMMPSNLKMHIGSFGTLSKEEIIEHLEKRDETGRRIVEMQLKYLRYFSKHMNRVVNG